MGTIRLILSDFVGQHRRRSERHGRTHPGGRGLQTDRSQGHGRRCRPGVDPRDHRRVQLAGRFDRRRARRQQRRAGRQRAGGSRERQPRWFAHRRQSNYSDPGPKKGMAGHRRRVHDEDRIAVKVEHGRPQHVPGPDHQLPQAHAGRPSTPGSPASGCGSSPTRASRPPSTTCGPRSGATTRDASRLVDGNDGKHTSSRSTTTRGPSSTARASSRQGLHGPRDVGRLQGPGHEDADRRPHPDRLRRQGRLARDGHVRHPQPPAQRLRLPCRPDGGRAEVDRPEGHRRLPEVGGVPPVPRQGLRRPDLAGRRQHARPEEGRDVLARHCSSRPVQATEHRPTSPTSTSSRSRRSAPSSTPSRRSTPRSTPSRSPPSRRTSPPSTMPPRPTSSTGPRARPR